VDFALFHDVPERWTGDWPAQVIVRQPEARKALAEEDRRISAFLALPSEHALSGKDFARFKAADRLELWLWTWEEEAMGNRMVLGVREELDKMFEAAEADGSIPPEISEIIEEFRKEGWRRHKEVLE
jgi:5'-deoxynucleotidase YfbR-like HD superfamily hydrolase